MVLAPKADEIMQATTHFRDKLAARDRHLTRQMKRLIAFRRYKNVHVYTNDTRTDGVFIAYRMQQPQHMNATRLYVKHSLLLQKFGGIDKENQEYGRGKKKDKTCFR